MKNSDYLLVPLNGKQGKCLDTCDFLRFRRLAKPQKMLVGAATPNTITSGQVGVVDKAPEEFTQSYHRHKIICISSKMQSA
jgi:hypothetical protein